MAKRRHRRRAFRQNPRPRFLRRRRFRRNPIAVGGFVNNTLIPAAVGAGGAIATDYLCNNLLYPYIPASMNTPTMQPIVKIGASLLVGWGVGAVAGSKLGGEAAAGGIIVALYNFLNQEISQLGYGANMYAPQGYGYGAGAAMNRYMNGMGFIRRRQMAMAGRGDPLDAATPQLGGGPYNQTKFRMMRNGGASGRQQVGYIGPAPTLGRHINNGR